MTLQNSPLSPRAIEGFHRRKQRKLERIKERRAIDRLQNKPSLAHAIGRLWEDDGLPRIRHHFGFPSDRKNGLCSIHIYTARSLHCRGLVRFEAGPDGTRLWLTEWGKRAAAAIERGAENG